MIRSTQSRTAGSVAMYRNFTDEDLGAIYAYLRSIPPIKNRVPEPLPPLATSATTAAAEK